MERWGVAVNGYWGHANIYRDTGPAWTFWLCDLTERLHPLFCKIPIPKFIQRMKVRDNFWPDETFTVEQYYGNRLCGPMSVLENRIFQFCYRRQRHAGIDVPLRDLIQAFGDQADPFWREEWDHGTERWAEDGPPDYLGKKWRTASGEL